MGLDPHPARDRRRHLPVRNDLTPVALVPSDAADVDPSLPGRSAADGVGTAASGLLDAVDSYGDSKPGFAGARLEPGTRPVAGNLIGPGLGL